MAEKYERREETPGIAESGEIVTVEIPSGTKYHIHAHILAHHSKYFRVALNSPMKEATTLHFNLVEHANEETLELFVSWIYSRSVPCPPRKILQSRLDDYLGSYRPDYLIEAWRLGDYLQAADFKNDVLETLHDEVTSIDSDTHPFFISQSKLEGLDTNSPPYCMLAAILGQEVYGGRVSESKDYLEDLGDDRKAAVMEYMAWFGAQIAYELVSNPRSIGNIVDKIKEFGDSIRPKDFFEETE